MSVAFDTYQSALLKTHIFRFFLNLKSLYKLFSITLSLAEHIRADNKYASTKRNNIYLDDLSNLFT